MPPVFGHSLGQPGPVTAQKCNFISSHIPSFSLTEITPKSKKSIIEALNSPPQHWPREAKRSQFSWHELKPVWQVYRACVNLTSEQKYLFPGGASPFLFSCLHLKAGTGYEKFMPFVLQTYPWRTLSICWLEQTLMVNMKNHVSEMLSSREENVCSESSENSSYHTWQKDVKRNILSNTPMGNGALSPHLFLSWQHKEYFILTDTKSDPNVLCNHESFPL